MAPTKRNLLWVAACTSTVFLIFFRARWAMQPINGYDDQCYLAWLHQFIGVSYPKCYSTSHMPGTALFWIPVGLISRLLGTFTGIPMMNWMSPLIGLQSILSWGVSLYLILRILEKLSISEINRKETALLWLLNIPILEFVSYSTFSTHVPELLSTLLYLYFLLNRNWMAATLSLSVLFLTRLNDFPALLLMVGAWSDSAKSNDLKLSAKMKTSLFLLIFFLGAIALGLIFWIGLVKGYNGVFLKDILSRLSFKSWVTTFFMGDWGLLWAIPSGILLFFCSLCFRKMSWLSRASMIWFAVELALVVGLNQSRSDYPNPPWRYLMGSLAGMIPLSVEMARQTSVFGRKVARKLLCITTIWQVYLAFVANSFTVLTYWKITQWEKNWSLLHYLYLLKDPVDLVKLLFLTPLGFSTYSWAVGNPIFTRYADYKKYALTGPSLYFLFLGTLLALCIIWKYGSLHGVFKYSSKPFNQSSDKIRV